MSKSRYITGLRAVEQVLAGGSTEIRRVYAEYKTANPRVKAVIEAAHAAGVETKPANRARLQQMSGEVRHQGVVAEICRKTTLDEAGLRSLVEARLADSDDKPLLLLALDGIQDPHNLGACLRTADAVGVDAVVVPRHGAATLGPTVSKVAAGAAEELPFATVANLGRVLAWLGDYGVRVVGTSDKADVSLFDADLSGAVTLVMGREHSGLSKGISSRCQTLVCLPMHGAVSSLNVSVATGVCLYEICRQGSTNPMVQQN
jgi:23S rRNA (guanosine2251-2'-O)-methyltransferase